MSQWISAVNSYYYPYMIYHVTHERLVFRHELALRQWKALLLGCAEQSSPKAACGAPKARGLTANAQTEQQSSEPRRLKDVLCCRLLL
jgi:hypothetical protein